MVGRWGDRPLFEVIHISRTVDELGLRASLPCAEGYLLLLHLSDGPRCALWRGGRLWSVQACQKDDVIIVDLRDHPRICFDGVLDVLAIYIAAALLDAVAEQSGRAGRQRLACWPGTADPLISRLGAALLPLFQQDQRAGTGFLEHVAMALGAHVVWRFGSSESRPAERTSLHDSLGAAAR